MCIVGELARGGSVAVGDGVTHMGQVSGASVMWHVTPDNWHLTPRAQWFWDLNLISSFYELCNRVELPELYRKSWVWLLYPPRKVHLWHKKATKTIVLFNTYIFCPPYDALSFNQDRRVSELGILPGSPYIPLQVLHMWKKITLIYGHENAFQECGSVHGVGAGKSVSLYCFCCCA